MSSPKKKATPLTQPAVSGGPPDPPKRTSKSSGDPNPEETRIRVIVPQAIEGNVLSYLNLLEGTIMNIEIERPAWTGIEALLPRGFVPQFKTWLHDFSKAQGLVSEEPQ